MKNDSDDVSFNNGLSYMVAKDKFDEYMEAVAALNSRKTNKKKDDKVGVRTSLQGGLMLVSIVG